VFFVLCYLLNFPLGGREKTNSAKAYIAAAAPRGLREASDAAATVAHAVKGGDGEKENDVDAATALPHAAAPVM